MALCAVAQIVISMPHHHHDGSDIPCYNFMHCIAEHSHHEGCAHGSSCNSHEEDGCKDHDHSRKAGCDHLALSLSTHGGNIQETVSTGLGHVTLIMTEYTPDLSDEFLLETVVRTEHRSNVGVKSPHVRYLVSALPPRAPSA